MTRRHFAALALVVFVGCGAPHAKLSPVDITGRLTVEGKPFGNVMLTLHPQDSDVQGQRPTALVNADGVFATRCLPGKYRVTLSPLPHSPGDAGPGAGTTPGAAAAAGIPSAYSSAASTPWTIVVGDSENKEFKHTVSR